MTTTVRGQEAVLEGRGFCVLKIRILAKLPLNGKIVMIVDCYFKLIKCNP
jgi:hypothetical protein